MVESNGKIYSIAIVILVCWVTAFVTFAEQHTEKITLVNLKLPVYQNDSAVPVIILYAEEAKPIGINFELKGVKLKWLGTAVSDVRGVVTTPAAIYDRSSNMITGNKWIKYRSKEMDLDGIGFDIDQLKQTIHIRSSVKVAIKSKFESNHQKRINNNKSKSSGKIDSAKLLRAIPKLVSFSKNGDSVSNNKKSNSTTKKNVKNTKQDSIGIATYIRIALSLAIALFFISWFYSRFKRRK